MNITEDDIGMQVYCRVGGFGEIIRFDSSEDYSVIVRFDGGLKAVYSADGKFHINKGEQMLFWDKPAETVAPPRPKKKVKKTYWANVYESKDAPNGLFLGDVHDHEKKEDTNLFKSLGVVSFELEVEAG